MRNGLDLLWLVLDPTPGSELEDILIPTTLSDLERHLRDGVTWGRNPTAFTVEKEAHHEAFGRLTAIRAAQAAAHASPEDRVDRIEIYGADGDLVYEADLKDITP